MDVTFYRKKEGVKDLTFEVWYFATVKQMKEEISKRTDVPVASMQLRLGKTLLMDDKNTEDYDIEQGSRIQLVLSDE